MIIAVLCVAIVATSGFWVYYNATSKKKSNGAVIQFKESLDLVGLPIVTFFQGNKKYHFLLDTGADSSVINSQMLENFKHDPIEGASAQLKGLDGIERGATFTSSTLYYGDKGFPWVFTVADLTALSDAIGLRSKNKPIVISGLIGSDFFSHYKYVLDFKKMIAYNQR